VAIKIIKDAKKNKIIIIKKKNVTWNKMRCSEINTNKTKMQRK